MSRCAQGSRCLVHIYSSQAYPLQIPRKLCLKYPELHVGHRPLLLDHGMHMLNIIYPAALTKEINSGHTNLARTNGLPHSLRSASFLVVLLYINRHCHTEFFPFFFSFLHQFFQNDAMGTQTQPGNQIPSLTYCSNMCGPYRSGHSSDTFAVLRPTENAEGFWG